MSDGDFERKFDRIVKHAWPNAIRKGMGRASLRLYRDTVMEDPTVPLDEGTLRGSGSIFVDGKITATAKEAAGLEPVPKVIDGEVIGLPVRNLQERSPNNVMESVVGFNTPYAAALHEADPDEYEFQEPSAGPKYLEIQMFGNRLRYMRIIAHTIKQEGGG